MGHTDSSTPRTSELAGTIPDSRRNGLERDNSTRVLLYFLLLLVVGVVLAAAIMFSDDSRVFLLKFTAAAILSIVPGWMYLQFVRNKGPSLYDEYVLNLFRLQIDATANLPSPPKHTTWWSVWKTAHSRIPDDATDNLYRRKFESVYGTLSVSTIGLIKGADEKLTLKERTETFGPVVMSTLLIAMAWALVLEPELLGSISLLGSDAQLTGRPVLPGELLRHAFIGAYAFIILDLVRRYFRDDLKSAAYLSATTRILFASALVVAAHAAGLLGNVVSGGQANAVAFFVGFFPRAGFTWLRAMLPGRMQAAIPQLESDYPLRHLDGLNIWYESRLIEEGIESMQNLCSASLVDLMLKTRLPIMRIIDWLDQAYLYLHLPKDPRQDQRQKPPPALRELRVFGIRTATDLQRVWEKREPDLEELLGKALIPGDPDKINAVMSSLMLTLEGEPNLWHVQAYRRLAWLKDEAEAEDGSLPAASTDLTVTVSSPASADAPAG